MLHVLILLRWKLIKHRSLKRVIPPQQCAAQSCLLTARLNLPTMNIVQWVSSIQTVEQELSAYLATKVVVGTDPLAFWHVSKIHFSFPWLTMYTT